MQATVQITSDGSVVANLDTDDYADDDDSAALIGLTADAMLEQCARVAIDTWVELRARVEVEAP
jgi:hypothetical protein